MLVTPKSLPPPSSTFNVYACTRPGGRMTLLNVLPPPALSLSPHPAPTPALPQVAAQVQHNPSPPPAALIPSLKSPLPFLNPSSSLLTPIKEAAGFTLHQRDRCWKQFRTCSGASPTAKYSSTYRQCHFCCFNTMPSM